MNNLCFVLMPFGSKPDSMGRTIDFDAVYRTIIKPGVMAAGLEPIRADEESQGGIIHKPMFERLILCAYAVADLTTANANVFYELGVRHAVRPWRTVSMFAEGARLPFDVNYLRSAPYQLDAKGLPSAHATDSARLAASLREARDGAADPSVDSPVYQLVDYLPAPTVDHQKTDLFRDQVRYSQKARDAFAVARKTNTGGAVSEALKQLRPLAELEAGVMIDAMLSFRAVKAWAELVQLVGAMPKPLRETVMVQEQLAFALNRARRGDEAERTLVNLLKERGPSSETLGILGRVYKDRWEEAAARGDAVEASGHLEKAISTYLRGFEADWRDAYPGVNALTLMAVRDPPDPRAEGLLPVVRYAVERKMAGRGADYWDHATMLELAVLGRDDTGVREHLGPTLAAAIEPWMAETTAHNLAILRKSRMRQGVSVGFADEAEALLLRKAGRDS